MDRIDWGRLVAVPFFAGLVTLNVIGLINAADDRSPLATAAVVLTLTFYGVLIVQYLRRGPASATDRRPLVWLVALCATLAPFAIPLTAHGSPSPLALYAGTALSVVGLGGALWSLMSLGRNISMLPQSRGLAQGGPYRFFRHPLYVFEVVSAAGLSLVVGGWAPWLIWAIGVALLVTRARWEEGLLAEQLEGYADYRNRTRGVPSRAPRRGH